MSRVNPSRWTLLIISLLAAPAAFAQSADDQWHFVVEPYVMFPNVHGTVGLDDLPDVSIDQSPSDLFSHLQFGGMLYLEAHDDRWAIASDFMYSNLAQSASATNPLSYSYARVDLKQILWEPSVLYRLAPWLEAGAGADLTNLKSTLNITLQNPLGQLSRSAGMTKTWVDPTIIARVTFPLSNTWSVVARGNVGGFNVSSVFTWQAQAYVVYRISDGMALSLGYRAISDDYHTGSGTNRFLYNVIMFGPVIKFAINF